VKGGGCGLRRPRSVHQRPPWTFAGAQLVKQSDGVLAPVAGEVAVVAVDHGQAGAHAAREVEGGDAGTEREGGEGVSEIDGTWLRVAAPAEGAATGVRQLAHDQVV
jgi:hypothetical protein